MTQGISIGVVIGLLSGIMLGSWLWRAPAAILLLAGYALILPLIVWETRRKRRRRAFQEIITTMDRWAPRG